MNWFCFVNKLRTRRCSLCVIFLLRQLSLTSNTENQPHVSDTEARERTETERETKRVSKACMRVAVLVFLVIENQPNHKSDAVDDAESQKQ